MLKIALTGNMGAGKSTAAKIIREQGFKVIDSDVLSRVVTAPGSPLLVHMEKIFGPSIIREDGSMDRARVAEIAFSNNDKYFMLNSLVQSAIKLRLLDELHMLELERKERAVFVEVPLLFEAGWQNCFDRVWLVAAPQDVRIERVKKRSGLTEKQALARMNNQLSQEYKKSLCSVVIENCDDRENLEKAVLEALKSV